MAIDLSNTGGPQRAGNVTVTVTSMASASLPKSDPGHSVTQGWRLDIAPPAGAPSLNGQQIQAPANPPATTFFQGGRVAAPVPDAAWNTLNTAIAGGNATATLVNAPFPLSNPLYIVFGT